MRSALKPTMSTSGRARWTAPQQPCELDLARVLTSAGKYDEAVGQCLKLPVEGLVRSECLGRARLGQGRISEALQVLTSAVDRGVPADHPMRGYLGYAYGRAGRRDEAERLATAVSTNPFQQALTFAGLGNRGAHFGNSRTYGRIGPCAARPGPYLSGICSRSWRSAGESSSQEGRSTRVAAFGFTNHDKRKLRV